MRYAFSLILACLLLTGCRTTSSTSENQPLQAERQSLEAEEPSLEAEESSVEPVWEAEPEFLPYESPRFARTTEEEVAVFQGSSTSSPIITRLKRGEEFIIYSRRDGFFAIAGKNKEPLGFVLQRSVQIDRSRPAPRIERREAVAQRSAQGQHSAQGQRPASAPTFGYKDPAVAHVLSFLITGGGQIYAGKPGKGVALLSLGAAAPLTGAVLSDTTCNTRWCDDIDYTPLYIGLGIGAGIWLYSFGTAGRDAREANQQNGFNFSAAPAAIPDGKGVRPGLALSLEW